MNNEDYTTDNVLKDIERHLSYLKSQPSKLSFIHKIIKETVNL